MGMVCFTNDTRALQQRGQAQVVVSGVITNNTLSCGSVWKPSRAVREAMMEETAKKGEGETAETHSSV